MRMEGKKNISLFTRTDLCLSISVNQYLTEPTGSLVYALYLHFVVYTFEIICRN